MKMAGIAVSNNPKASPSSTLQESSRLYTINVEIRATMAQRRIMSELSLVMEDKSRHRAVGTVVIKKMRLLSMMGCIWGKVRLILQANGFYIRILSETVSLSPLKQNLADRPAAGI